MICIRAKSNILSIAIPYTVAKLRDHPSLDVHLRGQQSCFQVINQFSIVETTHTYIYIYIYLGYSKIHITRFIYIYIYT